MPSRPRLPALLVVGAALVAACSEDRERLEPPRVSLVVDEQVVAPGDTVKGRIAAADRGGGIVRVAVRLCIDTGFQTQRASVDRRDTAEFSFEILLPVETPQNSLVIVEGQASDAQGFLVTTQDTIVARSVGFPVQVPTNAPSCARPGTPGA